LVVRKRNRKYSWLGKSSLGFCVCLVAAGTSLAQAQIENLAQPVEILKLKWEKQIRLPRNFDPSIISTDGAFSDPSRSTSSGSAGGSGVNPSPRPSVSVFPPTPDRLPVSYVYTLKVRNVGPKMIEGIAWDYAFLDASNGAEVARRQFLSCMKIAPTKVASLEGQMRTPHIKLVPALGSQSSSLTNDKRAKFIERAIIQCVLYADDSVWKNPVARSGVCGFLKSERALMRGKSRSAQR
jgi:hypothetical protein